MHFYIFGGEKKGKSQLIKKINYTYHILKIHTLHEGKCQRQFLFIKHTILTQLCNIYIFILTICQSPVQMKPSFYIYIRLYFHYLRFKDVVNIFISNFILMFIFYLRMFSLSNCFKRGMVNVHEGYNPEKLWMQVYSVCKLK